MLPVGVNPQSADVTAKPTTPITTIAPAPEHVGELAAEREQRRQRQQVAVDDPLRSGGRQRQVLLQVGDRDRDDRLVDERHRDREDHRGEHQALV